MCTICHAYSIKGKRGTTAATSLVEYVTFRGTATEDTVQLWPLLNMGHIDPEQVLSLTTFDKPSLQSVYVMCHRKPTDYETENIGSTFISTNDTTRHESKRLQSEEARLSVQSVISLVTINTRIILVSKSISNM